MKWMDREGQEVREDNYGVVSDYDQSVIGQDNGQGTWGCI